MELNDKDLASLQQVRNLLHNANEAKKQMAKMSQQQLDKIVEAIAKSGEENAERLAKLAADETGFGKWQDKKIKNLFASKNVYDAIKNLKTVGLIKTDEEKGIREYACPVGVIGALVPSTNPTSTVIYKSMIAIKSGNPIIFSPHPKALNCILETIKIIYKAAVDAGLPGGGISCISIPTVQATDELMRHKYTNL
ncbi:MAG: aldehyde dehydrogenase family protein, partial [Clostridia bacterium]|nr:aldehyde dehydrogenase family protein [Clostridia bacterium]